MAWNLAPVIQIIQMISEKYWPYIYQLTMFGGLMSCGSKDIFKNAPCLMYKYSSWCHWFGKSWNGWKCKNLNMLRMEHNFSTKQKNS